MPICSGELAPGTRMTQEELAASLSVSRQPVLQALRMLKRDGLAIDAGRRGLIVAPIDPALIERPVRGARSPRRARGTAREALGRGEDRSAAWSSAGGRPLARGHFPAMIDADIAFHNAIYAASGNPLIAESASRHWHHIQRAMGGVLQAEGPARLGVGRTPGDPRRDQRRRCAARPSGARASTARPAGAVLAAA